MSTDTMAPFNGNWKSVWEEEERTRQTVQTAKVVAYRPENKRGVRFEGLIFMGITLEKFWESVHRMVESVIVRLPSLILAIVVFFLFLGLSVVLNHAIHRSTKGHRENLGMVFGRLAGWATTLLGLLVGLSIVAPSFQASDLIKILGIGGVAIGFAFQNILQNFLAGLLLLWTEPFRVGDEIKLDAYEGTVEEIQTRATIIKTYDERRVVIPNADLFTHSVIVNTALGSRRWQYDVTIQKFARLEDVKKAIVNAMRKLPGVLSEPTPEALIIDVTPETIKVRVLWSTHDTRQHEMLGSYDRVLTAIEDSLQSMADGTRRKTAA
jgi:small conductance mechanosensitive channel